MDRPTCQTCPYWQRKHEYDKPTDNGFCNANPPNTRFHVNAYTDDIESDPYWPVTYKLDWCRHHPQTPAYLASLASQGQDPAPKAEPAPEVATVIEPIKAGQLVLLNRYYGTSKIDFSTLRVFTHHDSAASRAPYGFAPRDLKNGDVIPISNLPLFIAKPLSPPAPEGLDSTNSST